jgi:hypothetical protein
VISRSADSRAWSFLTWGSVVVIARLYDNHLASANLFSRGIVV